MTPTDNKKACLPPAPGSSPVSLTGEAQRSDESPLLCSLYGKVVEIDNTKGTITQLKKHASERGESALTTLLLVVFTALGLAVAAWFAALHTAKGIAKMQQDRVEAVERWAAGEDGR